jgi:hypothetical protein
MQFDWTLALPMTLLIIYFLTKVQSHYFRIFKTFRLPADQAVTGAFNIGGQNLHGVPVGGGGGAGASAAQPSAEEVATEAAYHQEIQQRYGHLPESVRAQMGLEAQAAAAGTGTSGQQGGAS